MNYNELLQHISPSALAYDDWLAVGMAIKHEGGSCEEWDAWSQADPRYKDQDCHKRWEGFRGSDTPVTAGTLYAFAKQQGYTPPAEDRCYDWNEVVHNPREDGRVVDLDFLEAAEIADPGAAWDNVRDLQRYIGALYEPSDYVGFVTDSTKNEDGKWIPAGRGCYTMTAREILDGLATCKGDLARVIGDYNQECGVWIRFNPLDGQGVRDANVTAYRYALVESDTKPIEQQAAIYDALELPCAALIHSGNKSLHAIVRVDAANLEEYKARVRFLHEVCKKNGLEIDTNNKNPSRLSRMPGAMRNGQKQYLVGLTQGKASWDEWKAYIEELNDNLPDFQPIESVWDALPEKAPALIEGILRQGHKMLLAGASKAGKSYLLLELAIAIAEGRQWLGWPVAQGKVLYVNLELDPISCLHRVKELYQALEWDAENLQNLVLWHLRGKALPLDALAPRLIRRAQKGGYKAIIIDPLYKILTGDENSAHAMAGFCNNFDRICAELGVATIYCHHHSKGLQGQKASRDRASGSGVFARDPDALLDLIELEITPERLQALAPRIQEDGYRLSPNLSAWRIEGTLREFPPLSATDIFFSHPTHFRDQWELLKDAKSEGEIPQWQAAREAKQERRKTTREQLDAAYLAAKGFDGEPDSLAMVGDIAEYCGVTVSTVKKWIKETKHYVAGDDGAVRTKEENDRYVLTTAIGKAKDVTGRTHIKRLAEVLNVTDKGARKRCASAGIQVENGYVSTF